MTKEQTMQRAAAASRSSARIEYDAFMAGCPSRALLDRISNKWVTLILCTLGGGKATLAAGERGGPRAMRFSELSRTLVGVSQKMLTQTLRSLERDGLLTRTVTPTVPVTVSYELTELGVSLHHLMGALKGWAETNMDEVLANRAMHDSRPASRSSGGDRSA